MPPCFATVISENQSLGVLYEFKQGARVWRHRQRRHLCVGGDLNGRRLTEWEISQDKYAGWYHRFNASQRNAVESTIWVFIPTK